MFEYTAVVVKVVDGDTIDAQVDLGFKIYNKQRLRLARINCPEVSTKEGLSAKNALCKIFDIDQRPSVPIRIATAKSDMYGRYIAEVFFKDINGNEQNLNDMLVALKLAEYVKY